MVLEYRTVDNRIHKKSTENYTSFLANFERKNLFKKTFKNLKKSVDKIYSVVLKLKTSSEVIRGYKIKNYKQI